MTGRALRVLVFDGVGENGPAPTMAGRLAALTGLPTIRVQYSRAYGPVGGNGQPYTNTLFEGMAAGTRLLDDGVPSILIGYSAGAHIAGNLVWRGHRSIVGAILIADPMQPASLTNNGLSGIAGQPDKNGRIVHRTLQPGPSVPIRWDWSVRDVICQCPADSPLRDLADFSEFMSLRPEDREEFIEDIRADFIALARRPRSPFEWARQYRRFARAADDILGYLPVPAGRGEHQRYGIAFRTLANWARTL